MVVLKHPRLRRRGRRWTQPSSRLQAFNSELRRLKPSRGAATRVRPPPPFPGPNFTGYEKWWGNRVEAPAPGPCADDGMNGERRLRAARPRSSARGLVTKDVAAGRRSGFTTSRRRCGPRWRPPPPGAKASTPADSRSPSGVGACERSQPVGACERSATFRSALASAARSHRCPQPTGPSVGDGGASEMQVAGLHF